MIDRRNTMTYLNSRDLALWSQILPSHRFPVCAELFYEGQIPHVGHIVLNGSIELLRNNRLIKTIRSGGVIGIRELLNNRPINVTARITSFSEVLILDRSTLQEIATNANHDLNSLFFSVNESLKINFC